MNAALLIPILGVSIPIIAILANTVFKPWLKLKERQMELYSNAAAEKAAQYASQTERLEQRVRVLERIVTDRGHDLAGEIERLRGQEPWRQDGPATSSTEEGKVAR